MKANEAPEKVYLSMHPATGVLHVRLLKSDDTNEYTRTDAFIEKACQFIETYSHLFMGVLRSEVIEDFKKYLEE